jgi:hypothetical protein
MRPQPLVCVPVIKKGRAPRGLDGAPTRALTLP